MANKIKLGYWGIRGRAQNSRLLLAYTGADWEDVKYADPNQWFGNDKIHLGLEFPNLPYLIEGDLKISESAAIERYIAQRSDKKELLGKDLADSARINQVNGVLADIRTPLVTLCFDKDYESKLKETLEKVKGKIELVNKYIGDKQWVLGYLTITDFYISELSYYLQNIFPQEYKNWGAWHRIREGVNNLEAVKSYYSSEGAVKGPFLPPTYSSIKF